MDPSTILIAIAGLAAIGFIAGRQRVHLVASHGSAVRFHSLPGYYGAYLALWLGLPLLLLLALWIFIEPAYMRAEVLASFGADAAAPAAGQSGPASGTMLHR